MKTRKICIGLLLLTAFATRNTFAQETVLASNAPAVPEATSTEGQAKKEEEKPKVTLSGYIDSYYLHAFNNPQSGTLMGIGGGGTGRAFDRVADQFSLGLVQTKFSYSDSKSDLVIDLTFGPNAELGNFGNTPIHVTGSPTLWVPSNGYVSQLYGTSAAIKQAYFTYKATSKLSFTVGQFGTHIGYEVIDAPVNYNYSLSNLFNNGPFYHIGAKVNYVVNDKMALMAGLVNNWDNLFDNNKQKSVIAQVYLKPVDGFNIYLNYIGGHGDDTYLTTLATSPTSPQPYLQNYNRSLFDLTAGYQVTPKFYLGLNAAYGMYNFNVAASDEGAVKDHFKSTSDPTDQGTTKPTWGGAAIYSNYAISDILGIGIRYEYFNDDKHARYIGTVNNSLTITAPITLADGHLIVKPEFRMDKAKIAYYENKDGIAQKGQSTFGAAFIYKY
jgi:hypothetical protein